MGLRQRSRRRASRKAVKSGRAVRDRLGRGNEIAVSEWCPNVGNRSEWPRCTDGMTDGAVLGFYAGRGTDGVLGLVVRLRQVGGADIVTCLVPESPEGDEQQQSEGPR